MNAKELGAIAAIIGKNRESVLSECLEGYDAKMSEMAERRQRQAAEMAAYNAEHADEIAAAETALERSTY